MDYDYCTADPAWYHLLKELAKKNRQHPTETESVMWEYLKGSSLGQPFRQQHIIGDYIVDFFCVSAKLIVEIDGGYHFTGQQPKLDEARAKWLEGRGYRIIRFTNQEVLCDIDNVINQIKKYL